MKKSLIRIVLTCCWTSFLLYIGEYIPHRFLWIGAIGMSFLFLIGSKTINKIFPKQVSKFYVYPLYLKVLTKKLLPFC